MNDIEIKTLMCMWGFCIKCLDLVPIIFRRNIIVPLN